MKMKLKDRCANQASRAIVKVVEEHTGKEVPLDDCLRLINVIGAVLSTETAVPETIFSAMDLTFLCVLRLLLR